MTFASQTWTLDTAATPWVYSDGSSTAMADNAQTITFTGADTGDGGTYAGRGTSILSLLDGNKLHIDSDKRFSNFRSEADGATYNCGSIWVRVNNGPVEEVKITTMTVTDGDAVGANGVTNVTFEYPGKPYSWSWTNINTA